MTHLIKLPVYLLFFINKVHERAFQFCILSHKIPVTIHLLQVDICIRPMVHIKTRCFFKHFFFLIKNEYFFGRINPEQTKRNGEIFYADAKEATKLYYKIIYSPGSNIYHDVFDLSHALIFLVMHL